VPSPRKRSHPSLSGSRDLIEVIRYTAMLVASGQNSDGLGSVSE
jgi:hypothetical protein